MNINRLNTDMQEPQNAKGIVRYATKDMTKLNEYLSVFKTYDYQSLILHNLNPFIESFIMFLRY
jgi:hypothetical protein